MKDNLPELLKTSHFFFLIIFTSLISHVSYAAIGVGKTVRITENSVNVRSSYGTGASVVGQQNTDAQGSVTDGPQSANGYTWWRVNFSSGADGWVASLYLQEVVSAPAPSISSVSPSSMPASGSDQTLTIDGSNFVNGATLTFNPPTGSNINSTASKLTFVSSTRIRYQINNGNDVGTWSVRVTNPDGKSSGWTSFTVSAPATPSPSISSVSPSSIPASSSDQTLTINGSNFVSGATLTFDPPTGSNINSTASKLTFVSSSQIRYQINNGNDAGTWSVRVTNPDGKSSGWSTFTVTGGTSTTPAITNVSPTSMPASSSDQTLTINGSNFVSGATLTFDPPTGSNLNSVASKLTFVSSSQIRYQINNANDVGTWSVRVTNPNGNSSGWTSFTVTAATTPSPAISSISPTSMPGSSSDQTLTINGSNFVSGATLTFDPPTGSNLNSTPSKLTFVSTSQIRYQINNANDVGTWSVRVTNPDGKTSGWSSFIVTAATAPSPSISSVSPTSMPGSNTDQTLTINGSNFVSGATLTFDPPTGSNLNSVPSKLTFVSASQIRYQINNANDLGTWSVRITNPDGKTSGWTSFVVAAPVTPAPSISSISPTSIPASTADQTLTINGSNFVSGATLTFDPPTGSNLTSNSAKLTFVSAGQIRYLINNDNDAGTWSVRVTNPDGKTSGWGTFTVTAPAVPGSFTLTNETPYWDKRDPAGPAVMLKWTQAAGATSYDVYRNNSLVKAGITGLYFTNETGMAAGQSYTFRVVAKNANGDRDSNSLSIGPMPGAPSNARPDLIVVPGSITFSPSSVRAGNRILITAQIRNQGNAESPLTKARFRISTDAILTSTDLPLSPLDVDVDRIAPGTTRNLSVTLQIPLPTPQGSYFVGIFCDPTNIADQSNTTNDGGLSSSQLRVEPLSGEVPIVISSHPSPNEVHLDSGDTLTLNVGATGTSRMYQWFRNEDPITGQNTDRLNIPNVGLENIGAYWARVSNSLGSIDSNRVQLRLNPGSITSAPPAVRCSFSQTSFDPSKPTVLITHGWQPGSVYVEGQFPIWMTNLRNAIRDRVPGTNVLLFGWPEAHTSDEGLNLDPRHARKAYSGIDSASQALATYLYPLIGTRSYAEKVHVIGHSFGTFVNAKALGLLNRKIDQFTLLDSPIQEFAATLYGAPLNYRFFESYDWSKVGYIDNYYSPAPFGVGAKITNAKPGNGGFLALGTRHDTIQEAYYNRTVPIGNILAHGFNDSVLINEDRSWSLPPSLTNVVTVGTTYFNNASRGSAVADAIVVARRGPWMTAFRLATAVVGFSEPEPGDDLVLANEPASEVDDDNIFFNLTIPENADTLSFEYLVVNPGDGDWLSVKFNNTEIVRSRCENFFGNDFYNLEVPVSEFSGQTGALTVTLHSESELPSEVQVGDFRFNELSSTTAVSGTILRRPAGMKVSRKGIGDRVRVTLSVNDRSVGARTLSFQRQTSTESGGWLSWKGVKSFRIAGGPRVFRHSLTVSRRDEHRFRAWVSDGRRYLYSNTVELRRN